MYALKDPVDDTVGRGIGATRLWDRHRLLVDSGVGEAKQGLFPLSQLVLRRMK